MPYLKGKADAPRTQMVHNTMRDHYAIRDGDWVLINAESGIVGGPRRYPPEWWLEKHGYPPADDQPVKLYNLNEDIGQRHNLAAEQPERVAEMQALLKQIRESRYPESVQ